MGDRAHRPLNLVFVVCHPDDEALWIGGLLCALPEFSGIRTHVICLSGRDSTSPREAEFHDARRTAGYAAGVVLGFPLRAAGEPLPSIAETTVEGLQHLKLEAAEVDLLVTHSPYGDEHANPHHVQAYRELRAWTRRHGVPFGYFSTVPMSDFAHVPLDTGFRRSGALHLLARLRCEWPQGRERTDVDRPAEYVQFAIDAARKHSMLRCYQSIDLDAHARGYAAFSSGAEGIYVVDAAGSAVVDVIVGAMPVASGNERILAKHADAPPTFGRRVARTLRSAVGR